MSQPQQQQQQQQQQQHEEQPHNLSSFSISANGNTSGSSLASLVPGGVVTTQNISTVIKPKENNKSMQFVKITPPDLSKKAVEQIRVAQESKISKDKLKEVEEEWQSNLLKWKSKRRQHFVGPSSNSNGDESEQNNNNLENGSGRKVKTFAEIIEQRAKTGNRLNFNLQRYIGSEDEEEQPEDGDIGSDSVQQHVNGDKESESENETIERPREISRQSASPLPPQVRQPQMQNDTASSHPQPQPVKPPPLVPNRSQDQTDTGRKVKTFAQIFEQRAKSGDRSDLNLQRHSGHGVEKEPLEQQRPQSQSHVAQPKPVKLLPSSPQHQRPLAQNHDAPPRMLAQPVELPPSPQQQQQPQMRDLNLPNHPQLDKPPPSPPQRVQIPNPVITPLSQSQPVKPPPLPPLHIQPQLQTNVAAPRSQPKPVKLPPSPTKTHKHITQPPPTDLPSPQPISNNNSNNNNKYTHDPIPRQKDDKDRTVLSVSGKRRCSSCKEELGRGAAAFVVESLNLVYHTNCFKCSVCHVDLSNGFRGVDVRVHAGALHCQNCYSKDGLNYSRV